MMAKVCSGQIVCPLASQPHPQGPSEPAAPHNLQAVPESLSLEEQTKPRAWITVMIAETQSGESASLNADLNAAYFRVLFQGLRTMRANPSLSVSTCHPSPMSLEPRVAWRLHFTQRFEIAFHTGLNCT